MSRTWKVLLVESTTKRADTCEIKWKWDKNTQGIAQISVRGEQKEGSMGKRGGEHGNGVSMWEETINSGLWSRAPAVLMSGGEFGCLS